LQENKIQQVNKLLDMYKCYLLKWQRTLRTNLGEAVQFGSEVMFGEVYNKSL
jgi:hypothetical protein